MKYSLAIFLTVTLTSMARATDDLSQAPAEKLIDELVNVDVAKLGFYWEIPDRGVFFGEHRVRKFSERWVAPNHTRPTPAMRELVRRGPEVLPDLIKHLDDARETKLVFPISQQAEYRAEYDPRERGELVRMPAGREFKGRYTLKVGDHCFALIGQIVNRQLRPSRVDSQPYVLVINSPLESPNLITLVKKDWADLTRDQHLASLVADAKRLEERYRAFEALHRLRFYYPDEYENLSAGKLSERIRWFEAETSVAPQSSFKPRPAQPAEKVPF